MVFLLLSSFSQFYPNNGDPALFQGHQNRIGLGSGDYYVFDCYFLCISYLGKGGSICCDNVASCYLLIEKSVFRNISSNGYDGGGVYFQSSSGSAVFYSVCGEWCRTNGGSSKNGDFCYCSVGNNGINEFHLSSYISCSDNSNGASPIMIIMGFQKGTDLNSTRNNVISYSLGVLMLSQTSDFRFWNMYNNSCTDYTGLRFCGGIFKVSFSSFVSNYQRFGLLYQDSAYSQDSSIESCIFLNNRFAISQSQSYEKYQFYNSKGTMVLNKCWISGTYTVTKVGYSNSVTSTSINTYPDMNQVECNVNPNSFYRKQYNHVLSKGFLLYLVFMPLI